MALAIKAFVALRNKPYGHMQRIIQNLMYSILVDEYLEKETCWIVLDSFPNT